MPRQLYLCFGEVSIRENHVRLCVRTFLSETTQRNLMKFGVRIYTLSDSCSMGP